MLSLASAILRHYKIPLVLLSFCLGLVLVRMVLTKTIFFGFLLWNLFLAILPYALSQTVLLYGLSRIPKKIKMMLFLIWLSLFPNAPYLISDLVHLHSSYATQTWFDLFLVFVFALTGWLFAILSLLDIYVFIGKVSEKRVPIFLTIIICFAAGYGVFLGRFYRFNSWDIIFKTQSLFHSFLQSIAAPEAWLVTLLFGMFMTISFFFIKWFREES